MKRFSHYWCAVGKWCVGSEEGIVEEDEIEVVEVYVPSEEMQSATESEDDLKNIVTQQGSRKARNV